MMRFCANRAARMIFDTVSYGLNDEIPIETPARRMWRNATQDWPHTILYS